MSEIQQIKEHVEKIESEIGKLSACITGHIEGTREFDETMKELIPQLESLLDFWRTLTYGRRFTLFVFGFFVSIVMATGSLVALTLGLFNIFDKIK